jgi:hypothetical protein
MDRFFRQPADGSRPNAKISRFAAQMYLPLYAFGDQKKSLQTNAKIRRRL